MAHSHLGPLEALSFWGVRKNQVTAPALMAGHPPSSRAVEPPTGTIGFPPFRRSLAFLVASGALTGISLSHLTNHPQSCFENLFSPDIAGQSHSPGSVPSSLPSCFPPRALPLSTCADAHSALPPCLALAASLECPPCSPLLTLSSGASPHNPTSAPQSQEWSSQVLRHV